MTATLLPCYNQAMSTEEKTVIYFSPSRWSTFLTCNRKGFLNYRYDGRGLRPAGRGALHFDIGNGVHAGCAALWEGATLTEALAKGKEFFDFDPDTTTDPKAQIYKREAEDITTALLYTWQKFRFPSLIEEYEPVLVEHPAEVTMYEDDEVQIVLYIIMDALLRRRRDGHYMGWELKTVKSIDKRWIDSWEHDFQGALEHEAAEALRMSVDPDGPPVAGVMVDALIKGKQYNSKREGLKRHSNALVWPWFKQGDGHVLKDAWSLETKRGWPRVLASQKHPAGLLGWLDALPDQALVEYSRTVPPIRLPHAMRQSFVHQVVSFLLRERDALDSLDGLDPESAEYWQIVDAYWPQNTRQCEWLGCEFRKACWEPTTKADPIGSGLYIERPDRRKEKKDDQGTAT